MVFLTRPDQDPNTVIVDRNKRKKLGQFKSGRFETEDEILIKRLTPHYKIEGSERVGVGDGECKVEGVQGSSQRGKRGRKRNIGSER